MDPSSFYLVHMIGLVGLLLTAGSAFSGGRLKGKWEHLVGAYGLFWLTTGCALGLFWAPQENWMGDVGRILYVHVPAAWIAMVTFTIAFVSAIGFLMTSRHGWDWTTEAACEVGVLLNGLLLVLGALFAKPTWNTYWSWDPRLTASLVMMLTFVGVLLLRLAVNDPDKRATWTSVATIIAYLNIPITYFVVRFMPSLHQQQSTPDTVDPYMTFVMRMCAYAFLFVTIWFLARRWRIAKGNAMADMPAPLPVPLEAR